MIIKIFNYIITVIAYACQIVGNQIKARKYHNTLEISSCLCDQISYILPWVIRPYGDTIFYVAYWGSTSLKYFNLYDLVIATIQITLIF